MSVEIPYCQSTGRSFEVYCCLFGYGLDGQGLVGKKILDIAAGRSNFAKEVQGKFPTTTAVGIDIKLNWHSQKVDGEIVLPGPYMVAAAQILPFRKDSFDDVLISNLLGWFERRNSVVDVVTEAVRVCKLGGRILISPDVSDPFTHWNPLRIAELSRVTRGKFDISSTDVIIDGEKSSGTRLIKVKND